MVKKNFFLLLVFFVFLTKGIFLLDPDFGWHLRLGTLILSMGFPKTDPFSYTMSTFPYIDHEPFTTVGIAWLYPRIGTLGLAVIYAGLALGALLVALRGTGTGPLRAIKGWYPEGVVFLLGAGAILPFAGVRPQVITWFFLAVFLRFIFDPSLWIRWRFLAPLFFLVWANLHGGFAAGIMSFLVVVFLRSCKQRKINFAELSIAGLSVLSTLINPYGIGLWREVWSSISDSSLRWKIAEWIPSVFTLNFPFVAISTLSVCLVYRYRKYFTIEQLVLFVGFLIQAISSQRHIPLWVVMSLPMTTTGLGYLYKEVKPIKYGGERFQKLFTFAFWGCVLIFIVQAAPALNPSSLLSEKNFYPSVAVKFLHQYPSAGEIFSSYGWGGYLIWKLPEKKVFIDGRMPSWRQENAPSTQSRYAMQEYDEVLSGKIPYTRIFAKYNIDTVLFPLPAKPDLFDKLAEYLRALFGKKQPGFDFFKKLSDDGWKIVYQDEVSVIYKK